MNRKNNRFISSDCRALNSIIQKLFLFLLILVLSSCDTQKVKESQIYDLPEGIERVCLSLRVLSKEGSKAISNKVQISEELNRLCGIGYLEGFIVVDEEEERDIILIGLRSKNRPALYLDDLIVNMRNIAEDSEYPYCSLDPRPEDIKALQVLYASPRKINTTSNISAFFQKLKSTVGPQQVVVGGVPRNSRHAHIMIDADYHMKKVSQGYINLTGMTSYIDRSLNESKNKVLAGQKTLGMGVSMARFWFHIEPNSPTFQEGKGIVWLEKCPVVLLTEKQMATSSGQLHDVKEDDPIAIAFAQELSLAFSNLTQSIHVYAELENLFRLRALLLAMKHLKSFSKVGMDFNSYLIGYNLKNETPMDTSLPGLANIKEWSHRKTDGNMIKEYYLFHVVCGGVGMDMETKESQFGNENSAQLFSFRKAALSARPFKNSLLWVIAMR